ncbi:NAD(P)H-quinone oxidoreductase [Thalassotalea maritima]|uniref:NAD(P)H-quinone oxidoreductase n=1 Tax=Thalassotalea maritima TaxID=3242416 RepID=UPI0035299E59
MQYISVTGQQALAFAVTSLPQINPYQVLINVKAIGINRADLLQRAGKYPPPAGESDILGLEVCGDVVAVGDLVHNVTIGDRVCGLVAGGGYAEFAKINADHIIKLPEHYSYEQGAALAEVFLTAYQSLFTLANLTPGESVLIHGGASGVGSAAIKLAKANGAIVTTTVSNPVKAQATKGFGADHVVNYKQQDIKDWQKINMKQGFDVIVDIVAGEQLSRNIDCLALDGRIVILAILGGRYCPQLDVAKMLAKRATIMASTLRNRSDAYKAQLVSDFCNDFYQAITLQQLTPVIDTVYSWHEADTAHQRMSQNDNIGKLILRVD